MKMHTHFILRLIEVILMFASRSVRFMILYSGAINTNSSSTPNKTTGDDVFTSVAQVNSYRNLGIHIDNILI